MKPPKAVSEYMAKLGKKGGETKGPTKARSSEQARAAVKARWAKRKQSNQPLIEREPERIFRDLTRRPKRKGGK
jgi:hypothetical protein